MVLKTFLDKTSKDQSEMRLFTVQYDSQYYLVQFNTIEAFVYQN